MNYSQRRVAVAPGPLSERHYWIFRARRSGGLYSVSAAVLFSGSVHLHTMRNTPAAEWGTFLFVQLRGWDPSDFCLVLGPRRLNTRIISTSSFQSWVIRGSGGETDYWRPICHCQVHLSTVGLRRQKLSVFRNRSTEGVVSSDGEVCVLKRQSRRRRLTQNNPSEHRTTTLLCFTPHRFYVKLIISEDNNLIYWSSSKNFNTTQPSTTKQNDLIRVWFTHRDLID